MPGATIFHQTFFFWHSLPEALTTSAMMIRFHTDVRQLVMQDSFVIQLTECQWLLLGFFAGSG